MVDRKQIKREENKYFINLLIKELMKENEKNSPVGFNTNTDQKKEQNPVNKGSKNKETESHTEVLDDENEEIKKPEKEKEHDDTDHEHDYKTPEDNQNKSQEQPKDQVDNQKPNQPVDKTSANQNNK